MKGIVIVTDKDDKWSKPPIPNRAVTFQAGLLSGSTWNWNLSRKSKNNNLMKNMPRMKIVIIILLLNITFTGLAQESYEQIYNRLKSKIESELRQPPASNNDLDLYLSWMAIKAKDRDEAEKLSYKAGMEGNPYWERKFFELSDEADNSGEDTKSDAMFKLMRMDDRSGNPGGYQQACYGAGPNVGERIYSSAIENGYTTVDIKERARCMMRYATNDLEARWLYADHEAFPGHYDSNGYQVIPQLDGGIECLPRGQFTTTSQGDPIVPADMAMEMVQMVRDICDFYDLDPEHNDATDLMVQYLIEKEVLCLKPSNEGHQWYIELAQQYDLDKAQEHMDGFYATIKGKVEREKNGTREPVADAEVEFEAPKDQKVWTANTDNSGNYKIEGVILHKNCGPFILTARGDGCFKLIDVPGPLEEPDKSFELEKNILLECAVEGYTGRITVVKSWNYTEGYGKSSSQFIGSQTVSFHVMFKPIPQMEGLEGQPITIFGPDKVTGTWRYNEDRYCSGDCDCSGLVYQEFGSGDFPQRSFQGLILITNVFPTDNKVVADQLGQFGLVNWYDIATPTENVPTQTRSKYYVKDVGCIWDNSTSSTNLTGSDARFKLKDINHLTGNISWSSSRESTGVSITDMTEAIYDQKPFDPEQDGTDYTYTVTWNLKAL